MRIFFLSSGILVAFETVVLACPACVVSNGPNDSWPTFWMLSAMGILPIVVAIIIGMCIARIGKYDQGKIT
jgi:hypothetical protein